MSTNIVSPRVKRILTAIAIGLLLVFAVIVFATEAMASFRLEYAEGVEPKDGMSVPQAALGQEGYPILHGTATVVKAPPKPAVSARGVWDRLAACESGGNWQTNTGNGYSGGLQFLPSTWRAAGGTRYAPTAHQATREQQIAVAEEWLAKTSWAQWPACSRKLGLR